MRRYLGTIVLVAAWVAIGGPRAAPAQAQTVQGVTFVGTVFDSIGAPPPVGASITLVVAPPPGSGTSSRICGSGVADQAGNYRVMVLPFFSAPCELPGTVLQLRVTDVPAVQTVALPGSPGTYVANFTIGIPLGGQPYTPPVLAPHLTVLNPGCSQVVVSLGAGGTAAQVAADVASRAAVLGIWHFDNSVQRFTGYFPDPAVPSDSTSLAPVDAAFVCVSTPTLITAP